MTTRILPSSYLVHCPACNAALALSPYRDGEANVCPDCGYAEPAGNAEVVTFISYSLAQYAEQIDLDTVFLKDNEFTTRECMEGNGLLPLFVERAEQMLAATGLDRVPGFDLGLRVIQDTKGLLLSRVVMNSPTLHLANSLALLSEVLHECLWLTRSLSTKYYNNQLCLDYLPNLNTRSGSPAPSTVGLQRATRAAAQWPPGVAHEQN